MSFILDSLKKLEQEKAEQDFETDLKTVLLKTEHSEKEVSELKTKIKVLLAVAGGVLTLAVIMAIFYYKEVTSGYARAPQAVGTSSENASPAKEGPPLASPPAVEITPSLAVENEPLFVPQDPGMEESASVPEFFIQESLEENNPMVALKEENAHIPVRDETLLPPVTPASPIPEAAKARFPEFNIQGIIFFGEGNPANYIIIRDKKGNRVKLREGEAFMKVELTEILPQKVRFLFEENLFEKEMGED